MMIDGDAIDYADADDYTIVISIYAIVYSIDADAYDDDGVQRTLVGMQ